MRAKPHSSTQLPKKGGDTIKDLYRKSLASVSSGQLRGEQNCQDE
jgi:hypothetical protein